MKKYVIERNIPGIGSFTQEQLRAGAAKSNEALQKLGDDIRWLESYVTADKTFCVYLAKDEAIIRRHAELSGFPANTITEVSTVISPCTALTGEELAAGKSATGRGVATAKSALSALMGLCALMFALAAPAMAQGPSKAKVPFDFKVGDTVLSAGTYTIAPVFAEHLELLALRDSQGVSRAIINGSRLEASKDAQAPHLTFNKDDDSYSLTEVWINDASSGTSVPQARGAAKATVARRHPAETVTVAMAD